MGLPGVIIAILLAALLLAILLMYFGDIFDESADRAEASTSGNQADQIVEAVNTFRVDQGGYPVIEVGEGEFEVDASLLTGTHEDVRESYLVGAILEDWSFDALSARKQMSNERACEILNRDAGVEGIPSCSAIDEEDAPRYYCCSETEE